MIQSDYDWLIYFIVPCTQACFSGGMFALGAQHAINGHSEDYMDLAKELAKTCHESYQRTGIPWGMK